MKRRKCLLLAGSTPLLSGCIAYDSDNSARPEIRTENIEIINGECIDDPEHSASAVFDEAGTELAFEGVLATVKPCRRLGVVIQDGAGYSDRAVDDFRVEVVTNSPQRGEDCDWCPSEIAYSARVIFEGAPNSIEILHYDDEEDQFVGPLDTV